MIFGCSTEDKKLSSQSKQFLSWRVSLGGRFASAPPLFRSSGARISTPQTMSRRRSYTSACTLRSLDDQLPFAYYITLRELFRLQIILGTNIFLLFRGSSSHFFYPHFVQCFKIIFYVIFFISIHVILVKKIQIYFVNC